MPLSIDKLIHYAADLAQHAIERSHYYVYWFGSSHDAHKAEHKLRDAFHDAHEECAMPMNIADMTHAHIEQMPNFATNFRDAGRILVVRTNCEPRAANLVRTHLGEPHYHATLEPA